jgi:hypothetical protein
MAQLITGIMQTKILNALDTYNHTAGLTSMYFVSISVTEQPPSGMSIIIQQNGVTKATAATPAAAQNHIDLQVVLNCAASDVISVVLSSSTPSDENINAIKGILKITPGTV